MASEVEIIPVPNKLKNKVSYGPDGIDDAVIEKAEAVIASLQGEYLQWVKEDFIRIQAAYDKAKALAVDQRLPAVKDVFIVSLDMKGQGGSFDFPLITEIGTQLCRFIERTQIYEHAEMEVLRLHIEAMRLVIANNMHGVPDRAGAGLLAGLAAIIAKVTK